MRAVPRLVAVPFLLAAAGILVVIGVVLDALLGPWAGVGLAAVVLGGLILAGRGARRALARTAAGRTCTCCTSSVHDPVRVL